MVKPNYTVQQFRLPSAVAGYVDVIYKVTYPRRYDKWRGPEEHFINVPIITEDVAQTLVLRVWVMEPSTNTPHGSSHLQIWDLKMEMVVTQSSYAFMLPEVTEEEEEGKDSHA